MLLDSKASSESIFLVLVLVENLLGLAELGPCREPGQGRLGLSAEFLPFSSSFVTGPRDRDRIEKPLRSLISNLRESSQVESRRGDLYIVLEHPRLGFTSRPEESYYLHENPSADSPQCVSRLSLTIVIITRFCPQPQISLFHNAEFYQKKY